MDARIAAVHIPCERVDGPFLTTDRRAWQHPPYDRFDPERHRPGTSTGCHSMQCLLKFVPPAVNKISYVLLRHLKRARVVQVFDGLKDPSKLHRILCSEMVICGMETRETLRSSLMQMSQIHL